MARLFYRGFANFRLRSPMFQAILKLFAGSHNRSFLRKCAPIVKRINALELELQKLSDEQVKAKTAQFKARLAKGEKLDALLPEAFAVVKNAARRLCGTKARQGICC